MHATMEHEGHQTSPQSAPVSRPNVIPATSGQKCAHCGFPLGQGFAFCPNCGMSLKTETCSACGQKVDPNWSACAYCGSPLGETEKQPAHH
ncbi:MAG: zinc ribbon domain-containing protein [Chloroflexi bacterium]|nr:zinc ribbon domain-containing protein [Chloroflexota bacterium]